MKRIYILLILATAWITCAQAQSKQVINANTFTLEYDASLWEAEPVEAASDYNAIDAYAMFRNPLTEMISIVVYKSEMNAKNFLQSQIDNGIGLLNGAMIGGPIDNASCWGTNVYFVNFGTELSGVVHVGSAVVGNVNGLLVYAIGITSDPKEKEYLEMISAIQFKKQ